MSGWVTAERMLNAFGLGALLAHWWPHSMAIASVLAFTGAIGIQAWRLVRCVRALA